jgi:hypothetical protein
MIPRGRGKAFPQRFINFQILSIWECFTLKLTAQGQFIDESGEGFTFAKGDWGGEFGGCDANAKPLQFLDFPCLICH